MNEDKTQVLLSAVRIAKDVFRAWQAHHEYKGEEILSVACKNYAETMEAALKQVENQDDQ